MCAPENLHVLRPKKGRVMVYFLNNVKFSDALMFKILDVLLGRTHSDFRVPAGSLIISLKVHDTVHYRPFPPA